MKPFHLPSDARRPREAPVPQITIGTSEGMFRGSDHFAIQGAIDTAARLGGGDVRILPGRYVLRNAVFLPSHVTLTGPGATIEKQASVSVKLTKDLDWYGWEAEVEDASCFAVGDGITLESFRIDAGRAPQASRHTIVGIEDRTLHLDAPPRINHWVSHEARAAGTHSLLEAQRASNVRIQDLALEGNHAANPFLDGNYGGAIFFHDCEDIIVQDVTIRNVNGDAVSWQVSHDVAVLNCTIENAAMLGFHPGSGSQRPVMRGNVIRGCEIGIYWCWGVRHGTAEENRILDCRKHGISTGHRDTDNLIRRNIIERSGEAGIFFRNERSAGHTAHRTIIEENTIVCPGGEAAGIVVARGVQDTIVRGNSLHVPPGGSARAIVIDPGAIRTRLENNVVSEAG